MTYLDPTFRITQPVNPGSADAKQSIPVSNTENGSFRHILDAALNKPQDLKFSAHAIERMRSRNIQLSPDEVIKLQDGVERVAAKGGRESLLFTESSAFLVSIKNRTVITAIDRDNLKENVFTNIDSALML